MKKVVLCVLGLAAGVTTIIAAGWDERVMSYAGKYVSCSEDAILFTADNGITRITRWDAEKIGKVIPTIEQLVSQDASIALAKAAKAKAALDEVALKASVVSNAMSIGPMKTSNDSTTALIENLQVALKALTERVSKLEKP